MQAFVISKIDYCNEILYGLPAVHVNRLQRVQNVVARLLTNTPRYANITLAYDMMIYLHWLPVKFRIIFKVNLMTLKALHGLAAAYLRDIISFNTYSKAILIIISDQILVIYPRNYKVQIFCFREFFYYYFWSYDAPVRTNVTSAIHGKRNFNVYIVHETIHVVCCAYIQSKRFP